MNDDPKQCYGGYSLGGNYIQDSGSEPKVFERLSGLSVADLEVRLEQVVSKVEATVVLRRNDARDDQPSELRVHFDRGFFRLELIDSSNEWGCRTFSNPYVENSERHIDVHGYLYMESAVTNDRALVLAIMTEFLQTGNVSDEYMK